MEGLLASPVLIPAVATLIGVIVTAALSARGVLRKTNVDATSQLIGHLQAEIASLDKRHEASEARADKFRDEAIQAAAVIAALQARVVALSNDIENLRNLAGDRRRRPEKPGLPNELPGGEPTHLEEEPESELEYDAL
jgi:peptidoglycan hydrolase CwlO-like protein